MKVFVTGAGGFVGSQLVPALLDRGHEVTVLTRDAAGYDVPEVQVIEGDLLGSEFRIARGEGPTGEQRLGALLTALDIDAAYYLVHSMNASGDFEATDRTAARRFVRATDEADVDRIVYLGGLGEDRDSLSPHLRSRREVERILADGDAALTTLRAAIIVGEGSASFELVRQLASRLPVMVTPKWVETRCQPIAIADVIAYLVGVLDVPETAGDTFDIGGPDVLTYREIIRRTGRQLGHEPFIVTVPVLTPRLSAYWIGLVSDVPQSVARPLIEGLRNPVVVSDTRIENLVDVDPTPFDLAVARALGQPESTAAETTRGTGDEPSGDGADADPSDEETTSERPPEREREQGSGAG